MAMISPTSVDTYDICSLSFFFFHLFTFVQCHVMTAVVRQDGWTWRAFMDCKLATSVLCDSVSEQSLVAYQFNSVLL